MKKQKFDHAVAPWEAENASRPAEHGHRAAGVLPGLLAEAPTPSPLASPTASTNHSTSTVPRTKHLACNDSVTEKRRNRRVARDAAPKPPPPPKPPAGRRRRRQPLRAAQARPRPPHAPAGPGRRASSAPSSASPSTSGRVDGRHTSGTDMAARPQGASRAGQSTAAQSTVAPPRARRRPPQRAPVPQQPADASVCSLCLSVSRARSSSHGRHPSHSSMCPARSGADVAASPGAGQRVNRRQVKGRQLHLGSFSSAELAARRVCTGKGGCLPPPRQRCAAAHRRPPHTPRRGLIEPAVRCAVRRAYDRVALLLRGPSAETNFPASDYEEDTLMQARAHTRTHARDGRHS